MSGRYVKVRVRGRVARQENKKAAGFPAAFELKLAKGIKRADGG